MVTVFGQVNHLGM